MQKFIDKDAQSLNDRSFGTAASLAPGSLNAGYESKDASLEVGYEKWRLRAGYKLRDNIGTGVGVSSALDPVGKSRTERIIADLSWTDPDAGPHWELGATLRHMRYTEVTATGLVLFPAGATFPTGTFAEGMIGTPGKWERQWRLSTFAGHRIPDD